MKEFKIETPFRIYGKVKDLVELGNSIRGYLRKENVREISYNLKMHRGFLSVFIAKSDVKEGVLEEVKDFMEENAMRIEETEIGRIIATGRNSSHLGSMLKTVRNKLKGKMEASVGPFKKKETEWEVVLLIGDPGDRDKVMEYIKKRRNRDGASYHLSNLLS